MAKKYRNSCQTQDRINKKTILAYLGIFDIKELKIEFNNNFDSSFANPEQCATAATPNKASGIQKLFYKMCLADWDVVSYDSHSGEVCIILHKSKANNIISLNIKKN